MANSNNTKFYPIGTVIKGISTLLLGSILNANAAPVYHDHRDIQQSVAAYLENNLQSGKNIEIKTRINPLDRRLRLIKCDVPLSVSSTSNINQSAKVSVGVKCSGSKPWSLYVAVNIKKMASLYVTTGPLSRGESINEDNIQQVKRDINKLRNGFYTDKHQILGMIAKRSIRPGTIISSKHLTPPMIIKKGEAVDIIAKTSSLTIRMGGKAMSDGAKGQKIRVKNNSSKKIINAIVLNHGLVKVRL